MGSNPIPTAFLVNTHDERSEECRERETRHVGIRIREWEVSEQWEMRAKRASPNGERRAERAVSSERAERPWFESIPTDSCEHTL
ncbi:hypothetical protein [Halococcus sp. AFM35]|uniref:hypothetical protein n=1 Tax=Halococcus sp. AFM35 TaxID=3421653 RepID=UPI003EBE1D4A